MTFCLVTLKHSANADKWLPSKACSNIPGIVLFNDMKTGERESRTNRELEEMGKGENIVKWIKGQRLSWLGHLERMEEDKMPKKIFTQELEGMRRWKEEEERDLQVMGVRRWKELVADRKKWKDII